MIFGLLSYIHAFVCSWDVGHSNRLFVHEVLVSLYITPQLPYVDDDDDTSALICMVMLQHRVLKL